MEFKTPKDFQAPLVQVGGALGGMVGSNALVSTVTPATATDNTKLMISGGVALASVVGFAMVSGNDTSAQLVKSALLGMAVAQGYAVAKSFVAKSETASANRLVAASFGLNAPRRNPKRRVALREPMVMLPQAQAPQEQEFSLATTATLF